MRCTTIESILRKPKVDVAGDSEIVSDLNKTLQQYHSELESLRRKTLDETHLLRSYVERFEESLGRRRPEECCALSRDIRCEVVCFLIQDCFAEIKPLVDRAAELFEQAGVLFSALQGDEQMFAENITTRLKWLRDYAQKKCGCARPALAEDECECSRLVELVKEACADAKWDFRTIDGIVAEKQLDRRQVELLLRSRPDVFRRSPVPDKKGNTLFTLAHKPIRWRERLAFLHHLFAPHSALLD